MIAIYENFKNRIKCYQDSEGYYCYFHNKDIKDSYSSVIAKVSVYEKYNESFVDMTLNDPYLDSSNMRIQKLLSEGLTEDKLREFAKRYKKENEDKIKPWN